MMMLLLAPKHIGVSLFYINLCYVIPDEETFIRFETNRSFIVLYKSMLCNP